MSRTQQAVGPARKAIVGLVSASALLALSACMPSEYAYLNSTPEQAEDWLHQCETIENDAVLQERYCGLALRAQGLSNEDRGYLLGIQGNNALQRFRYDDAVDYLNEAISLGETGKVFGDRAYARAMLGDFDGARADYRRGYDDIGFDGYLEELDVME